MSELVKQIGDYQLMINELNLKYDNLRRMNSNEIEEYSVDSLINEGFIRKDGENYQIILNITEIIGQNIKSIKLDSKIEIIK